MMQIDEPGINEDFISTKDLAAFFGISKRQALRYIRKWIDLGYLNEKRDCRVRGATGYGTKFWERIAIEKAWSKTRSKY